MIDPTLRHRHIIRIILTLQLIAAALLSAGCHDHSRDALTLHRAEALMEEHPDSALQLIESLPQNARRAPLQEARRTLLETQARIKTNRPIESDSTIARAADYFMREAPGSSDCMKALYYHSQVLQGLHGYDTRSMQPLLPAYKMAEKLGDPLWIARTAEQMGMWYDAAMNDSLSLMYSRISADRYLAAGKELNYLYAMTDIMVTLNKLRQYERSIALVDSLLPLLPADTAHLYVRQYILRNKLEAFEYTRQYAKADSCISLLDRIGLQSGKDAYQYLNSARVKIALGEYDKAQEYIAKSMPHITDMQCRTMLFSTLQLYYAAQGDYGSALAMTDSIAATQTVGILPILRSSTSAIESDYYHQEALMQQATTRMMRIVFCICAVAAIIVAAIGIYAYKQKIRRKNDHIEQQKNQIENSIRQIRELSDLKSQLSDELHERDREIDDLATQLTAEIAGHRKDLQDKISPMLLRQYSIINKICTEFTSTDKDLKTLSIRNSNILGILEQLNQPHFMKDIESMLDSTDADVIKRLRRQLPTLSDAEINIILLTRMNFKKQAIAMIFGVNPAAFYKRISRLQSKIKNSDAPDKDEFLSLFRP